MRRAQRACAALAVGVASLLGLAACSGPASSEKRVQPVIGMWPMYQLRSDHNAVVDRPGFSAAWRYDAHAKINGGLAIAGDTVILDDFHHDVTALDVRNGHVRWKTPTDNIVMSTPVVVGSIVYIGTGHNGSANNMDRQNQGSFVYDVPASSTELAMWARPEGDHVIALDAATGEQRWTYRTAGEDMPSPALVNGVLVFANGDFHAYGLEPRTGAAIWQRDLDGIATMASAAISGTRAIVSVCSGTKLEGHTIALDARTGAILWNTRAGDCDSAPTIGGGRVFVSGVDGNTTRFGHGARGIVNALDSRTGRVLWTYRSPEAGPYTKISSNERAIAGTFAANLYFQPIPTNDEVVAFDPGSGAVRWRLKTSGPVKMSPVVKDGVLYVGDTSGLLYRVDAERGTVLHVQMFDDPFTTSPPVIVGKTIIVVNGNTVFAEPI
jgi:outer membrane protein assembly factor BamB